jgi:hypothetical protein
MKYCPQHGQFIDQYKFCPLCAWPLDENARRADFELGRLEALNTIKQDIINWFINRFGLIASAIGLLSILLGFYSCNNIITTNVEKSVREEVNKEVSKEVDIEFRKISDQLRKMVNIFPIIEYDFYRIKDINLDLDISVSSGTGIRKDELNVFQISSKPSIMILEFPLAGLFHGNKSVVYKGDNYAGELELEPFSVLEGKPIDILSRSEFLDIFIFISIFLVSFDDDRSEQTAMKIVYEHIKTVNVSILVNNIYFKKHEIPIREFECNFEVRELVETIRCHIRKDVSNIYKNVETVRDIYRSRLNYDRQIQNN